MSEWPASKARRVYAALIPAHAEGRAVDINLVDGEPVGPDNKAARRLQEIFQGMSAIEENLGPFVQGTTAAGRQDGAGGRNERCLPTLDPRERRASALNQRKNRA